MLPKPAEITMRVSSPKADSHTSSVSVSLALQAGLHVLPHRFNATFLCQDHGWQPSVRGVAVRKCASAGCDLACDIFYLRLVIFHVYSSLISNQN